jgi:hypothetical protein
VGLGSDFFGLGLGSWFWSLGLKFLGLKFRV